VLGAGLAGMAAAKSLVDAGHDVTLLEAQERAGGRIHTVRGPDGLFVEAGATHLVGDPHLIALLDELGVAYGRPRRRTGLSHPQYFEGTRTVLGPEEEPQETSTLSADEQKLYDRLSMADFLRAEGRSPGFVAWVAETFMPGDAIEQSSALSLMREAASIVGEIAQGGGGRISGGSDKLPAALAARLGERIRYRAVVRRLEQDANAVRIAFEHDGMLQQLEADRVVCAIPYTVLRTLDLPFSAAKRRVIDEMRMAPVARIWARSRRRFWSERGESGTADTDLGVGMVKDETELQEGAAGILGAYVTRDRARALCRLSEAARLEAAVADFDKVHPGLRDAFVDGGSKCWDDDPFARGAYCWFATGQLSTFGEALTAPEGRIHFAGDHTSHRPGFMHGALASARRVVAEVEAALRG
jgi:monoamine oxidase